MHMLCETTYPANIDLLLAHVNIYGYVASSHAGILESLGE